MPPDTVILDIAVTYPSAEKATQIANAIGAELTISVDGNLSPVGSTMRRWCTPSLGTGRAACFGVIAEGCAEHGLGLILALLLGLGSAVFGMR